MKEFLSVNEFSKLSGIEKTTLRYWDEIGLFSPVKRDPDNNYRYYSPDQLIAVHFVTVMSTLNIPLKIIDSIKKERNPKSIILLIEQQEKYLDQEMRRLQECYSVIHERRTLMLEGIRALKGVPIMPGSELNGALPAGGIIEKSEPVIDVVHMEEQSGILGPPNEFGEGEDFHDPFSRFGMKANELRINLSYPIGGFHETPEGFINEPGRPDRFISLDPMGNHKRPAGNYLVAYARGYYGRFGDLPEKIKAYTAENDLTLNGPVYTVYVHDEICIDDPSKYLVQVCVAASKRRR